MYRSIDQLMHYKLSTTDEETARMKDVLFDQSSWDLHYLVVKTGSWLVGRQVLFSPAGVEAIRDDEKELRLSASSEQVRESPAVSTDLPIASEAELLLAKFWSWAPRDAEGPLPPEAADTIESETSTETKEFGEEAAESNLRGFQEVKGYTISAPDGEFGHLEDLLYDEDWGIHFAVVDTRNWIPGKKILLPVRQIEQIKWSDNALHIDASCQWVKSAPAYDSHKGVTEEDEDAVRRHFSG